jgi:hypothetical protein
MRVFLILTEDYRKAPLLRGAVAMQGATERLDFLLEIAVREV